MSRIMSAALLSMVLGATGNRNPHPSPKPGAKRRRRSTGTPRRPINRVQEQDRRRSQIERGQCRAENRGIR